MLAVKCKRALDRFADPILHTKSVRVAACSLKRQAIAPEQQLVP